MSETANQLFNAMETMIKEHANHLEYETSMDCQVTSTKQSSQGIYTVSNEGATFKAYGLVNAYNVGDWVRVSIPNNNFSNFKYIYGKSAKHEVSQAIMSPSTEIIDVTGNLIKEVTGNFKNTQQDLGNKLIWKNTEKINLLIPNIDICNSIIFKVAIKTDSKTSYEDIDYGFSIRIGTKNRSEPIVKDFWKRDMVGNYNSFKFYSPQEFNITLSKGDIITSLAIAPLYKINNLEINVSEIDDDANIYYTNLYIGIGISKDKIKDNQLILSTSSEFAYNAKNSQTKVLDLFWANLNDENNKFIGFSDGIYDPSYTEEVYLIQKDYLSELYKQALAALEDSDYDEGTDELEIAKNELKHQYDLQLERLNEKYKDRYSIHFYRYNPSIKAGTYPYDFIGANWEYLNIPEWDYDGLITDITDFSFGDISELTNSSEETVKITGVKANTIKQIGLPGKDTENKVENSELYYRKSMITKAERGQGAQLQLQPLLELNKTRCVVVLFYNHKKYKSTEVVFNNEDAVINSSIFQIVKAEKKSENSTTYSPSNEPYIPKNKFTYDVNGKLVIGIDEEYTGTHLYFGDRYFISFKNQNLKGFIIKSKVYDSDMMEFNVYNDNLFYLDSSQCSSVITETDDKGQTYREFTYNIDKDLLELPVSYDVYETLPKNFITKPTEINIYRDNILFYTHYVEPEFIRMNKSENQSNTITAVLSAAIDTNGTIYEGQSIDLPYYSIDNAGKLQWRTHIYDLSFYDNILKDYIVPDKVDIQALKVQEKADNMTTWGDVISDEPAAIHQEGEKWQAWINTYGIFEITASKDQRKYHQYLIIPAANSINGKMIYADTYPNQIYYNTNGVGRFVNEFGYFFENNFTIPNSHMSLNLEFQPAPTNLLHQYNYILTDFNKEGKYQNDKTSQAHLEKYMIDNLSEINFVPHNRFWSSDHQHVYIAPYVIDYNRWFSPIINDWDENAIVDSTTNHIFGQHLTIGHKDIKNRFTGFLVSSNYTSWNITDTNFILGGIVGFRNGVQVVNIDIFGNMALGKIDNRLSFNANIGKLTVPKMETKELLICDTDEETSTNLEQYVKNIIKNTVTKSYISDVIETE